MVYIIIIQFISNTRTTKRSLRNVVLNNLFIIMIMIINYIVMLHNMYIIIIY